MSARRGAQFASIGIWNTNYLLENLSHKTTKMLSTRNSSILILFLRSTNTSGKFKIVVGKTRFALLLSNVSPSVPFLIRASGFVLLGYLGSGIHDKFVDTFFYII